MSRIRSRDTKPELFVRRLLFAQGFRYRLCRKDLPGRPDIVLKKYKTVVFVNGCFWHQHPGCARAVVPSSRREYWLPKLERNRARDARAYEELSALGWRVIVVWECACKMRFETVLSQTLSDIIKQPAAKGQDLVQIGSADF